MNGVTLTLDYPISANRYWRTDRGHVHISTEAEDYKTLVGWKCREAQVSLLAGPVELIVHAYTPSIRADLGNVEKVLSDALQGHCYTNDVQLHHIELFRHEAAKPKRQNARVVVTIRKYKEPANGHPRGISGASETVLPGRGSKSARRPGTGRGSDRPGAARQRPARTGKAAAGNRRKRQSARRRV